MQPVTLFSFSFKHEKQIEVMQIQTRQNKCKISQASHKEILKFNESTWIILVCSCSNRVVYANFTHLSQIIPMTLYYRTFFKSQTIC